MFSTINTSCTSIILGCNGIAALMYMIFQRLPRGALNAQVEYKSSKLVPIFISLLGLSVHLLVRRADILITRLQYIKRVNATPGAQKRQTLCSKVISPWAKGWSVHGTHQSQLKFQVQSKYVQVRAWTWQ